MLKIDDVKNSKVIRIYELDKNIEGRIEIVCKKDGIQKSLSIISGCHFGPMYEGCWFDIDISDEELPKIITNRYISNKKKTLTTKFTDIDLIEKINIYTNKIYNGTHTDLEILYKNHDGEKHSYLFHSTYHEDEYEVHDIIVYKDKKSTYKLME